MHGGIMSNAVALNGGCILGVIVRWLEIVFKNEPVLHRPTVFYRAAYGMHRQELGLEDELHGHAGIQLLVTEGGPQGSEIIFMRGTGAPGRRVTHCQRRKCCR
jgi:hypothetical protein